VSDSPGDKKPGERGEGLVMFQKRGELRPPTPPRRYAAQCGRNPGRCGGNIPLLSLGYSAPTNAIGVRAYTAVHLGCLDSAFLTFRFFSSNVDLS
jgi:hypothetical protein